MARWPFGFAEVWHDVLGKEYVEGGPVWNLEFLPRPRDRGLQTFVDHRMSKNSYV